MFTDTWAHLNTRNGALRRHAINYFICIIMALGKRLGRFAFIAVCTEWDLLLQEELQISFHDCDRIVWYSPIYCIVPS